MSKKLLAAGANRFRRGSTVPGVDPNPTPDTPPAIVAVYSTSSDRSSPSALTSATLTGTAYIFLETTTATRVMFFVDTDASDATMEAAVVTDGDPSPAITGFVRGDATDPHDLRGGTTTANPWDTTTDPAAQGGGRSTFLEDGAHTLKVAAVFADGQTTVTSFAFDIDNSVAPPAQLPQVPAGLAAGTGTANQLVYTWTDTADSVGGFDDTVSYDIRYGTANPPSTATPISILAGTGFTRSGIADGVYYAQVRGVDGDGDLSDWSSAVAMTVTAPTPVDPSDVTSWFQFYPAGDGVNPQPNAMLGGLYKGNTLESQTAFTDDIQYPVRGGWSSPTKLNTNLANTVRNAISGSPSSAVERYQSLLDNSRFRKAQHPSNGGFGSEIGDGTYGSMLSVNFTITQRKHSSKTWLLKSGVWEKSGITTTGNLIGTPGLPTSGVNRATYAEDSAVSYALLLSGALDAKLVALANELIDNQSGGRPYGDWAQRVFMRLGWEVTGGWSSDWVGINPNLIGSTVVQTAAAGGYSLPITLNARSIELLEALTDPGDPAYEVFHPNTGFDDVPGYREILVGTSNPDAGTGGDLSTLAAEAYVHVFDVLANAMADRCAFRSIDTLLPLCGPNFAHPGAAPDSSDDGDGFPAGWGGTGTNPLGGVGDPYQPYEQSRQLNLRYLDLIGREHFAYLDMDFYGRNSLLSNWEVEVPELVDLTTSLVARYKRPFCSSECGWTARGDKDTAPVDRVKLAGFLDAMFNPITGMFARLPVGYVVHYIPDGNAVGVDRYRLVKSLDNVGTPNPWQTMKGIFPGRGVALTDFWGQT